MCYYIIRYLLPLLVDEILLPSIRGFNMSNSIQNKYWHLTDLMVLNSKAYKSEAIRGLHFTMHVQIPIMYGCIYRVKQLNEKKTLTEYFDVSIG